MESIVYVLKWFFGSLIGLVVAMAFLSAIRDYVSERSKILLVQVDELKRRIRELEKDNDSIEHTYDKYNPPRFDRSFTHGKDANWYVIIQAGENAFHSLAVEPMPGEPGGVNRLPEYIDILFVIPALNHADSIQLAKKYLRNALGKNEEPPIKSDPFPEL